jgi:hypothetical protein
LALARAKVLDDGPVTKSKEAALVAVSDNFQYLVEIPWLDGVVVNLIEMVRVVSASFDLIDKAYDRMEKHITLLQTVNKNIMMDFQRPST